jgi:hypothetical protein
MRFNLKIYALFYKLYTLICTLLYLRISSYFNLIKTLSLFKAIPSILNQLVLLKI